MSTVIRGTEFRDLVQPSAQLPVRGVIVFDDDHFKCNHSVRNSDSRGRIDSEKHPNARHVRYRGRIEGSEGSFGFLNFGRFYFYSF